MSDHIVNGVCWACRNVESLKGIQGLETWGINDCFCSNPPMYCDDYDYGCDYDDTDYDDHHIEELLAQQKEHLAQSSSFGIEPYNKEIPNKGFLKNCARGKNFLPWNGNPATFARIGETLDEMASKERDFTDPKGENPHWGYQEGWYYIPGKSKYPLKKMKMTDRKWMQKIREKKKHKNKIPEKKLERIATAHKHGTTVTVSAKQCRGSSSRYPDDDNRKGRGWERDTRPRRWMKEFARSEVCMWNRGDYTGIDGSCSTSYKNHCCS
jgi:hypothetical protein